MAGWLASVGTAASARLIGDIFPVSLLVSLFGAVALTRNTWRLFRCQESMEIVLDSSSGLSGRPISRVCPRLGSWQLVQCGGGSAGGFDRVFLRQTQVMAQ